MSQPDTITLAVDELNNGTPVNLVLTNFDRNSVRSQYIGPCHRVLSRDSMTLFRSPSKPNGNFPGVEKTSIKFTWDREITGVDGVSTLKAPAILEIGCSLPVGMTDADKVILRQRAIAALDHAFVVALQTQLLI